MKSDIRFADEDWRRLASLRERFLAAAPGPDYWEDEHLVRIYDATFGARIGWKWRAVLAEARRRGFRPGPRVLDLGCGSGAATRAFVSEFGGDAQECILWDRSRHARRAALALLTESFPTGPAFVERHAPPTEALAPDVILASHVLGELAPTDLDALLPVLASARAIVWVEPGSRPIASRLVALREMLRDRFRPIAPCPHGDICGMTKPGRERDWCHLFAAPDPEAFRSAHWRRFSDELGIDLRSLPMSYLVMVREDVPPPDRPGGTLARPLGRPKPEKGRVLLDLCRTEGIVRARLIERDDRELARELARPRPFHPLLDVELDGERLRAARVVP